MHCLTFTPPSSALAQELASGSTTNSNALEGLCHASLKQSGSLQCTEFHGGGGGQGNHLGAAYGRQLLYAMKSFYAYNSLAQEKTGDF